MEEVVDKYYKFRLTFLNEAFRPKENADIIEAMMEVFKPLGLDINDELTVAYHPYNARGYETKPHFHIHFKQNGKTLAAMRKAIQTYCKSDPKYLGHVGNTLYSLTKCNDEDIKDIRRFYRYPFKMTHLCDIHYNNYFDEEELELQKTLATDEFEREKSKLLEADEKAANKMTTYDKFLKFIEDEKLDLRTKKEIQRCIVHFYKKEKMSCNPQTMSGYVHTYMLCNDLVDVDKWIEENMR